MAKCNLLCQDNMGSCIIIIAQNKKATQIYFYASAIFIAGGGGHIYVVSPLSVLSFLYIPSIRNKNGFCLVSFEKIRVSDSNFIPVYNHKM